MAKKKLLVAALLVGLFAAGLLYLYAKQLDEKVEKMTEDQVAVIKAARTIPAGTKLTKDKVTTEKVPRKFLPPNPLLESDLNIYLDSPVAVNIEDGAMILTSDFSVTEVSRSLAAKVPGEERAMTVAVDAVSGVAGLLKPGDRVDILGTFPTGASGQTVKDASGKKEVGYVTMTLLQNVTLLAVGNRISDVGGENQQRQAGYSTVTVSVTIDEAELLTITQTRGKLMFLLRNREDVQVMPIKRMTLVQVLKDLELIQVERTKRRKKPKKDKNKITVTAGDQR